MTDRDLKERVLSFILNFSNPGTVEAFTQGCCYWFAHILYTRFRMDLDKPRCIIMYNDIAGHFACEIGNALYDITGEIPKDDSWTPFSEWYRNEPVYGKVVIRDCIIK